VVEALPLRVVGHVRRIEVGLYAQRDEDGVVAGLFSGLVGVAELAAAVPAPGGEVLDEHRPADQVSEAEGLALGVDQLDPLPLG
jgi:hypothetical protein